LRCSSRLGFQGTSKWNRSRLQVDALAGGVGGQQDAERVLARVGVERSLDLLALGLRRRAVVDRDAVLGTVGALDHNFELLA
jgi:hypothetical protein